MRPVIGITTSFNDGEQRLNHRYVHAIERAGGLPVIVPMLREGESLHQFVDLLDGLMVTGGPAIVHGLVGRLPEDLSETDPVRSRSDEAIVRAFIRSRRPVFGICYGMQLLNALAGGSIYADVERQRPGSLTHSEKRGGIDHNVSAKPGSLLAELLGTAPLPVNTKHVQAVAEVGEGLSATLFADDGCVEGVESADGLLFGVQFHPEQMEGRTDALFSAFVRRSTQKTNADF